MLVITSQWNCFIRFEKNGGKVIMKKVNSFDEVIVQSVEIKLMSVKKLQTEKKLRDCAALIK